MTAIVAQALAAGFQYGFDIAEATLLRPATVYRVLRRLEELEFVRAEWEDATIAHREGRPPRRYYTLRTDSAELLKSARGRFPGRLDRPRRGPDPVLRPAHEPGFG